MHRLLYERTGTAVWISHLDMMRGFQRCFARAGIRIKHSEGFNPHAYIAIALPLSVGTESVCEILDFGLEDASIPLDQIPARLNACFPDGIRVIEAYESTRKIREMTLMRAQVTLEYDNGVPEGCVEALAALYARDELIVMKKKKKGGLTPTNIRPMILSMEVTRSSENTVTLLCVICAQEPSLNPEYLVTVLRSELPELAPDFHVIRRLDVLDSELKPFR